MNYWGSFSGQNRIAAGDLDKVYVPYGWDYAGKKRGVIWLHGSGSNYAPGPMEKAIMDRLGVPWVCSDLAGAETWMGAPVMTRITDVWTWMKANLGAKTDKVVLWGGSMGGGNALQYALENPANVAAVGAAIPALDPEFVRLNNVGGKQAAIQAVHGANPVPTNKQPKLHGADWDDSIPAKLWYSTTDGYTPQASTETFISDAGVEGVSMGAVGHAYTSIYSSTAPLEFLLPHV